jgi:hypothetical protein
MKIVEVKMDNNVFLLEWYERGMRYLERGWIESARDQFLLMRRFRIITKSYSCI